MIDPVAATAIIGAFILIFGVIIPILNVKKKKMVSFRWCVVVVILSLMIGALIDFDGLSDGARDVVLRGGLIIAGGYIVLRSIEKALAKGWLRGAKIEAKAGDKSVTIQGGQDNANN